MMRSFKAIKMVGKGPEGLAQVVEMLVDDMYGQGFTRVGQRDAIKDDPLDMMADIAEHDKVKVLQFGSGPEMPVALDSYAASALAVSWLAKLKREDYPTGKGYRDSYEMGWLLMSKWGRDIELCPAWIGVSK